MILKKLDQCTIKVKKNIKHDYAMIFTGSACVFDCTNQRVKLFGVRQFFVSWALVLLGRIVQLILLRQVIH
jgi:hypothetical protein